MGAAPTAPPTALAPDRHVPDADAADRRPGRGPRPWRARLAAARSEGTCVADAPSFMHGHGERDADQAAGLLRQDATRDGLRPVALHAAFQQGSRAMLTQFAADWFHPDDRGHQVWADALWREMSPDAERL